MPDSPADGCPHGYLSGCVTCRVGDLEQECDALRDEVERLQNYISLNESDRNLALRAELQKVFEDYGEVTIQLANCRANQG